MTITISEKEYNAVAFALTQVETEVEAASDEQFIAEAGECCAALYNIMNKYKKARAKAIEFQYVRAEVARRNRKAGLRPRDIDKLTRQVIKKMT